MIKVATPCETNNSKLNETNNQLTLKQWTSIGADITHFTDFQRPCIWTKVLRIWILLNKKRSKFNLAFRSNFFKTWKKKYYIPEICKNSKTTQLRMHQKRWIHFPQIFLCVTETHAIILLFHMFLWCSFTNSAWSHGINERNGWMIVTPSVANTDFSLKVQNAIVCQRVVFLY